MRTWVARAEARKKEMKLTDADVDALIGKSGSYREWVKRGRAPSIENARSLARALGYTLNELFEGGEVRVNLFIQGISKGDSMWAEVPGKHSRVIPLVLASEKLVSVEIGPGDAAPEHGFRVGDILSGEKVENPDNLKGRQVIALASSGKRMLGTLHASEKKGCFTIRPLLSSQKDFKDVVLEWAAPVQFIVRAP